MKKLFLAILFLGSTAFAQENTVSQRDPQFLADLEIDFKIVDAQTTSMQNNEPWNKNVLCEINKFLRERILEVKDDSKDPRIKPFLFDAKNIARADQPVCMSQTLSNNSLDALARDNGKLNIVLFAIYVVSKNKATEKGLSNIFDFTDAVMSRL